MIRLIVENGGVRIRIQADAAGQAAIAAGWPMAEPSLFGTEPAVLEAASDMRLVLEGLPEPSSPTPKEFPSA